MPISSGSYTIGGTTPDYSTITLFEDDISTTLTGVVTGNVRAGTYDENVIFSSSTNESASLYVVLQADTGAHHLGQPGDGVILYPTSVGHVFQLDDDYTRFIGLSATSWLGTSSEMFRVNGTACRIEECIAWGNSSTNADGIFYNRTGASDTLYVKNCLFLGLGRTAVHVQGSTKQGTIYVNNCTAIGMVCGIEQGGSTYVGMGDDLSDGPTSGVTWHIKNTYVDVLNSLAPCFGKVAASSWGNSTNNASADTSAPGTNAQTGVTMAAQFVQEPILYEVGLNTSDDATGSMEDSYLNADAATTNYGSSAEIQFDDSGNAKRPIVRFDLSGISDTWRALSARIESTISLDNDANMSGAWFRVLRAWTESGVTWNTYDGSTGWTTAGASGSGDIEQTGAEGDSISTPARTWTVRAGDFAVGGKVAMGGGLLTEWTQDAIDGVAPAANANHLDLLGVWQAVSDTACAWDSSEGTDGERWHLQFYYDKPSAPVNMVPNEVGAKTISLVGFNNVEITSSPFNFTIPSGTTQGDLILVYGGGRAGPSLSAPSGLDYQQEFAYTEGGNTTHQMWWRRAGPDEGGNTEQWASSNVDREREATMIVFRGVVHYGSPFDATHVKTSAYDDTPSAPAITTNTNGAVVVYSWGKRMTLDTATEDTGYPASATGVHVRYIGTSGMGLAYRTIATAGSVSAEDWGQISSEANLQIEVAVALKPDPGGDLEGNGTDLSSDTYPVTTDITGATRTVWDIGAWMAQLGQDELGSASVTLALTANTPTPYRDVWRTASAPIILDVGSTPMQNRGGDASDESWWYDQQSLWSVNAGALRFTGDGVNIGDLWWNRYISFDRSITKAQYGFDARMISGTEPTIYMGIVEYKPSACLNSVNGYPANHAVGYVGAQACNIFTGTETTLASALSVNDTTVSLTSGTGWEDSTSAFFVMFDIENDQSDVPNNTYLEMDGITGTVVSLTNPSTIARSAGTKVRQCRSGGTHQYSTMPPADLSTSWASSAPTNILGPLTAYSTTYSADGDNPVFADGKWEVTGLWRPTGEGNNGLLSVRFFVLGSDATTVLEIDNVWVRLYGGETIAEVSHSSSGSESLAITTSAAAGLDVQRVALSYLNLDADPGYSGPVQFMRPISDVTVTNFEDEGAGTTDIYASIDEATRSDSDYIVSTSGAGATYEGALTSSGDPEASWLHVLKVAAESDGGATEMDATFSIVEGTTVIASWTVEAIPAGLVEYEFRMTPEQADTITDYANLRWRVEVVPSVGLLTYFPGDPKGTFTRTGEAYEWVP